MAEQMTPEREDRVASAHCRALGATQDAAKVLLKGYGDTGQPANRRVLESAVEELVAYLGELDDTGVREAEQRHERLTESALQAIWQRVREGDEGNARRVLGEYGKNMRNEGSALPGGSQR